VIANPTAGIPFSIGLDWHRVIRAYARNQDMDSMFYEGSRTMKKRFLQNGLLITSITPYDRR